ncbi:MAG: HD domain-containing phosphohydrolase [bacterium]
MIEIKDIIQAVESIIEGKTNSINLSAQGEAGELICALNKMLSSLQTKNIEVEERLNEKLLSLYELNYATKMISFTMEMKELLDISIDMITDLARVEKASIMLINSRNRELVVEIVKESGKIIYPETILRPPHQILSEVINEGKIYLSQEQFEDLGDGLINEITSFLSFPIMGKEQVLGVANLYNCLNKKEFSHDEMNLISTLISQVGISIENARLFIRIKELFWDTVKALASTIDAKDPYTYGHSERVAEYSVEIAKRLGWSVQEQEEVQLAGLLHDIGKIGIPDDILHKPGGLDDKEFEKIKLHPLKGSKIMEHISQLEKVLPGMKHHHERFSGGGYPDNLKGDEVPLIGRIICVADAYDAMTSNRAYRNKMTTQEALSRIKNASGTQFDPQVVEAFLKVVGGEGVVI